MAQRQFRSDDTSVWGDRFGSAVDGAYAPVTGTDATPNTTITGSAAGTSATVGSATGFANGNLLVIHQTQGTGAGNWELNKIASGASTTSWTLAYPLANTYGTGAQVYFLKQYSSVNIATGQTLTAQGWNGSTGGILALLANQSVTVTGTISANGKGFRGGSGQINPTTGTQGEGESGIGSSSTAANGEAAGGSSQDDLSGGAGGHVAAGGSMGGLGGSAGNAGGDMAGLTTVLFGGAGGGGEGHNGSGAAGGTGGGGGGLVLLISRTITVSGTIDTGGANGADGANGAGSPHTSGGGGGAGGAVLIKGQFLTLGSNLITASGGVRGAVAGTSGTGTATGAAGRIHADYAFTLAGTTTPSIDSRTDTTFVDPGGMFFFNLL